MDMIGQNMLQTSNSLLSPTKLMVARATTSGNQGQPMMHTPLYTPMHESHLLRVPTTAHEIIGIDQPN